MDERMKEDVRQLQTFLTNQERLLSKEQFEQLRETQYQSVLKRVGSHRMGWEGINALSGLIETGPWTDEQKAGLGMALGECSKDVASCGKKSRPNQVCPDFTPFWSQEDVLVLRAPETSLVGKLEQIAARLVTSQHIKLIEVLPTHMADVESSFTWTIHADVYLYIMMLFPRWKSGWCGPQSCVMERSCARRKAWDSVSTTSPRISSSWRVTSVGDDAMWSWTTASFSRNLWHWRTLKFRSLIQILRARRWSQRERTDQLCSVATCEAPSFSTRFGVPQFILQLGWASGSEAFAWSVFYLMTTRGLHVEGCCLQLIVLQFLFRVGRWPC